MNNPTANNKTKIVALLPMRHSSERVPGKNYRLFSGRPLFYHILQSLLACSLITRVLIDTDSPIIMDEVSNNFPDVTLIKHHPVYVVVTRETSFCFNLQHVLHVFIKLY